MEMVVISKEDLKALIADAVSSAVSSFDTTNEKEKKKTKIKGMQEPIDIDSEIANWIPLKEAWSVMAISKEKWYRKYQHVIKHKPYSGDVWVYKPSIYSFFIKDNIN